ncbi:hypothetical protein PPERSA_00005 [Pseudocohnilembus persalinus]|uniref:Uncharacterized protein n=1 Tax=Pseudocohnilembus persalinus TaxID=266149 RepID=A0A0V0QVL3_PSEPJ|nr:hypothetical protein PPERSA_00005 [Pseudocohnilembus persalinus]|eukprot:KRX06125.1 hypothetical protein PPERSA_00005 [Pseudocohnilembus persalinus]
MGEILNNLPDFGNQSPIKKNEGLEQKRRYTQKKKQTFTFDPDSIKKLEKQKEYYRDQIFGSNETNSGSNLSQGLPLKYNKYEQGNKQIKNKFDQKLQLGKVEFQRKSQIFIGDQNDSITFDENSSKQLYRSPRKQIMKMTCSKQTMGSSGKFSLNSSPIRLKRKPDILKTNQIIEQNKSEKLLSFQNTILNNQSQNQSQIQFQNIDVSNFSYSPNKDKKQNKKIFVREKSVEEQQNQNYNQNQFYGYQKQLYQIQSYNDLGVKDKKSEIFQNFENSKQDLVKSRHRAQKIGQKQKSYKKISFQIDSTDSLDKLRNQQKNQQYQENEDFLGTFGNQNQVDSLNQQGKISIKNEKFENQSFQKSKSISPVRVQIKSRSNSKKN